ncbi:alpha-galactosidase [Dyadobacter subterraneus]|uniref:Alpha-galactosidase n=1 Tax=Dyadobacter subterraneus TaxID=2773304 RepID=A0ABR9WAB0_9BACT|nr:alpha-galactosidase [Dyadobacter subterraneus]MBE9462403.1 alpha-galactosidase [Dyadobacter subterraneus]
MSVNFKILTFLFCCVLFDTNAQNFPVWKPDLENKKPADWLVQPITEKAEVFKSQDGKDIVLYNGLLKRTFRITPDLACVDFKNLSNGQQLLRAVKAEARITINGKNYNVGGLYGQKENAYLLPEWVDKFKTSDSAFHYVRYTTEEIKPYLNWKTAMWTGNKKNATGKTISFYYTSSLAALKGLEIAVHYSLYDGLPLISKWVTIQNNTGSSVKIDQVVNEILAVVEEESAVVGTPEQMAKPNGIYIENNFAFNNAMRYPLSDQATHWKVDPLYTSQVNYDFKTPCLLEIHPKRDIGIVLKKDEFFESVRTYELLNDKYDRERNGLAVRKMYRAIAPWTTSNPIFMHLVSKNDQEVRTAIDQCAATGYEALILSFGSHCNMEDTTAANLKKWKELADYAHGKNIFIGSYSLFSSRKISPEDDVIDPKTGKPGGAFFGNAPCMGSKWGLGYIETLKHFMTATGFNIFENDGPYPGDVCASTTHPGHQGLEDSQWKQMELQKGLYRWCNQNGVYVNAPDWYFLDGTNKIALGYREVNFSLSREQQMILNRQNIFDAMWSEIPSMVWGFVPLTKYQGGGPEAILEPLSEHLDAYRQLMMQYYGAGIQACYRGPRLYDTDVTKKTVIEVVDWYKKYRDILNSDVIHLRRADGRDWDGIMHVNPGLKEKGLVMLYNPLNESITRDIKLPVYYTSKHAGLKIRERDGVSKTYQVDREFNVPINVQIPARGYTWLVLE